MLFSEEQIQLAVSLKRAGLQRVPRIGDYVYDADKILPYGSPFQFGVYCLVDFACFMKHAGGELRFRERMIWLPTWIQARQLLRDFDVSDADVAVRIRGDRSIESGEELNSLYRMTYEVIQHRSSDMASPIAIQ